MFPVSIPAEPQEPVPEKRLKYPSRKVNRSIEDLGLFSKSDRIDTSVRPIRHLGLTCLVTNRGPGERPDVCRHRAEYLVWDTVACKEHAIDRLNDILQALYSNPYQ